MTESERALAQEILKQLDCLSEDLGRLAEITDRFGGKLDAMVEKIDQPPLPPIDEEPLVNDVWTWESELGSWIVAMQRAGVDQNTIAEVLKQQKRVKLSPQDATRIYREFIDNEE